MLGEFCEANILKVISVVFDLKLLQLETYFDIKNWGNIKILILVSRED